MIELETKRLLLRQWRNDDFEHYAAFFADETNAQYIGGRCDRDEAWRRMATIVGHWTLRGYGFWAVEEQSTCDFCGSIGLWYPEGWPERECGWWLMPDKQGLGYATEAAQRSRQYAYETLGWPTLVSYIDPGNTASEAVAKRLGCTPEHVFELCGHDARVWRHPPQVQM